MVTLDHGVYLVKEQRTHERARNDAGHRGQQLEVQGGERDFPTVRRRGRDRRRGRGGPTTQ